MEARFQVGQQFPDRFRTVNGEPVICTITDIHRTYNAAGELVRLRYVATHEFCGQTVTETDICDTTIARRLADQAP